MKRIFIIFLLACMATVLSAQQSVVFETRKIKSEILNMEQNYAVYLPPGYEQNDQHYPVLYLLHGAGDDHTGWVQFGQVQHIADKAFMEGKAVPMIIVMPNASAKFLGYFNQPDGSFDYERFFFEELIPHIEKNYRVRGERRYRAVSGLSMGGGGTVYYTLHHPEVFAAAAPLSATTGAWLRQETKATPEQLVIHVRKHNLDSLFADATATSFLDEVKRVRWYVSCGDDDFLYKDNSLLHILFRDKQIPHEYRVKNGAHNWTYWRMELPEVLEFVSKSFTQE